MKVRSVLVLLAISVPGNAADFAEMLGSTYSSESPGAAVVVMQDDEILFRGASGMADLELGVELQPDHVFRLASITKQFTAAAILILQERGKLNVADDITDYLPDFPTQGHTITIRHLLTHTSGIFNNTDDPAFWEEHRYLHDVTTAELIDTFKDIPLVFEPGEQMQYSNSGYILLGAIIEEITGEPYYVFIEDEIFRPLGMDDSHNGGQRVVPKRVNGYYMGEDSFMNSDYLSMTQPHAAGSLLSTVDDLTIWTKALFGGDLLPLSVVNEMTTNHSLENGRTSGYGYGFFVSDVFGHKAVSHSGGIPGFNTHAIWLPDQRVYVAVLANITEHETGPTFLATRMALAAADIAIPFETEFEVSQTRLADYVGEYEIAPEFSRKVMLEDGKLFTIDTHSIPFELKPFAKDKFYYENYFEYVVFRRDDAGAVTHLDIHYEGSDTGEPAPRIDD